MKPTSHTGSDIWGLHSAGNGELMLGNHGTVGIAEKYGTPLHVVNERRLRDTAHHFSNAMQSAYGGPCSIHYAFKCNPVAGIINNVRQAGLKAEVVTEFELELAVQLGFSGEEIIGNGPSKTERFIERALEQRVKYLVADSLDDIDAIDRIATELGRKAPVLLRVNQDYRPAGMNRGTATASRTGSWFGLDLHGGEVEAALHRIASAPFLRFGGYHFHIGTGIQRCEDYADGLGCLKSLRDLARKTGHTIDAIDIGGGFGTATAREYTSWEMLLYSGFGKLPKSRKPGGTNYQGFAEAVAGRLHEVFAGETLPELICEPGRCITGPNQFLLLTVQAVKQRNGAGTWVITDGGLSTVTMPTYYEQHHVFLCNDLRRDLGGHVTLTGPACFAGDIVYRNIRMPHVRPGEILAIMDTGAYFTALESSFGFYRPAILGIDGAFCHLLRSRETFEDAVNRDIID